MKQFNIKNTEDFDLAVLLRYLQAEGIIEPKQVSVVSYPNIIEYQVLCEFVKPLAEMAFVFERTPAFKELLAVCNDRSQFILHNDEVGSEDGHPVTAVTPGSYDVDPDFTTVETKDQAFIRSKFREIVDLVISSEERV